MAERRTDGDERAPDLTVVRRVSGPSRLDRRLTGAGLEPCRSRSVPKGPRSPVAPAYVLTEGVPPEVTLSVSHIPSPSCPGTKHAMR